tara:strand:+ start:1723 stop:2067 length:345 start_codon:yes stop_codon:yes gene_type:complete
VESITPGGLILLTKRSNLQVQDIAKTRLFAEVELKGIPEPVSDYEVLSVEGMPERMEKPEPSVWKWEDGEERRRAADPFPKAGIDAMSRSRRISAETMLRETDSEGETMVWKVL